ncbi:cell surface protein [Rhodopirellula sp. MGV]|uniref:cell surface protein n=1 Tax=Rhodopirellula sp. MGV TaxID=2023130 RepID=UPI000B9796D6|nr:cell surface protein [Rhodopirellula sp. MGV]OYP31695.1 cell surface protein [Rhodopirellula sp. MGV]PNY33996.1 cell surface protein [Rhodopirellula baltica]
MSKQATASANQTQPTASTGGSSKMREYLNSAVTVLREFGVDSKNAAPQELITLLESVKHLDEAKVLAIADVIQHMGAFNALVRENVESIQVGNRYLQITQEFDSIREDSKRLIAQLDDGKISGTEKLSNWWMKIRRGTPTDRFEKITETYAEVAKDTKAALKSEDMIMDAYIDFRFALKEAEVLARELFDDHLPVLEAAKQKLADAQDALDQYAGTDQAGKSQLELARDEARKQFEDEDETYQLLKDIAENLQIGYDVGETLVTKLKQTHDVKERVYRRAVTFFTTNEHVFTILGTVYQSQHGLHEVTQATEAMKEGVNKGLEDIATLGRELERAALKAGYGSTIDPESVQKLVDAISDFQVESLEMIAELRKESEQSTKAIRKSVEEGKKKYQETLAKHARGNL